MLAALRSPCLKVLELKVDLILTLKTQNTGRSYSPAGPRLQVLMFWC